MGNFGTIMAHNYATFYVMIFAKGYFQNLQHDIEIMTRYNNLNGISQKFFFWAKWVILPQLCSTFMQASLKICSKEIFQTLQQGHNMLVKFI